MNTLNHRKGPSLSSRVSGNHSPSGARDQRCHRLRIACVAVVAVLAPAVALGDAPPPGAYADWLQDHFPVAFGDPLLEATVWGDQADPDGDGCVNLIEFVTVRDPNEADPNLGLRCRIEGEDVMITYRETTATNHGISWLGEWSVDIAFWVQAGVRYEVVETHADYRLVEARITRNRELLMQFRLAASR